jgi:hypothetical protein
MIPTKQSNFPSVNGNLYYLCIKILVEKNELTNFSSKFISQLSTNLKEETFSLNAVLIGEKYFFSGYPSGNYLKIFCKIFEMWEKEGCFPISYQCLPNLEVRKKKLLKKYFFTQ